MFGANDSAGYAKLFAKGAIRIPTEFKPEHGLADLAQSAQNDYDVAHVDGATSSYKATKT